MGTLAPEMCLTPAQVNVLGAADSLIEEPHGELGSWDLARRDRQAFGHLALINTLLGPAPGGGGPPQRSKGPALRGNGARRQKAVSPRERRNPP